MKKGIVARIALSVLGAHGAAFALLLVCALWAADLDNTEKVTVWLGFLALGIGFAVCGLLSRKMGIGIAGALVSGLFYAASLSAVSLIFGAGGEGMSLGMRLGIFFVGALLSALIALVPSKKSGRSHSMKKKRSAVSKYMEGKE